MDGATLQLDFRILGPLEVVAHGESLPLGGQKQKELLALLVVHARTAVPADRLVDELWSGSPPATAQTTIQVYVSRLRKLLEPGRRRGEEARVLVSRSPGYALDVLPEQRDLDRFDLLSGEGREALESGRPAEAAARLAQALELWRGPALADFVFAAWAQGEISRLEEKRFVCVEDRLEAELACGRHAELVSEIAALTASHPLRERLWEQLMTALYRSGRQADALEAYTRLRERLVDELGIDPRPELQELHRAILNQDRALAAPAPVERRTLVSVRLPAAANPLIGRERELEELRTLFAEPATRLVTITGPGGVGKTRLSLAVATEVGDGRSGGAVWVGLQALRDPSLVVPTIAQALDVEGDLAAAIGDRDPLLCLDNFEQLLPAGGDLTELLAACPNLRLLVTSRELLHVSGEHEYPLAPLGEPDAVVLFTARARAVQPDFEADGDIDVICRRLDNLPLAIELAAARVKVLTPQQIRERLELHLPVLAGGPRDAPERQRTLAAAIAWSYDLLDNNEQELFRRLAVFAGGCTLEAAEEVAGAEIDTLQSLLDKSLLRRSGDRYWTLETILEHAHGLLEASDESEAIRSAHADWCLRLTRGPDSATPVSDPASIELLARERDNFRAALSWALGSDRGILALEVAVGLEELWETRGPLAEGSTWLARALDAAHDAPRELRVRALHDATSLAARQGDHEAMAMLAATQLSLARETADHLDVVRALVMLATVAGYRGDDAEAFARSDEAVAIATESGDPRSLLTALNCRGVLELGRGGYAVAGGLFERCLELAKSAGRRRDSVATAEFNVGFASLLAGDEHKAVEHLEESLRIYRELRHFDGIGYCFVAQGALAAREHELIEAARTLGAAETLLDTVGAALEPPEQALYTRTLEEIRAGLPPDAFARAWSEGTALAEAELAAGGSE